MSVPPGEVTFTAVPVGHGDVGVGVHVDTVPGAIDDVGDHVHVTAVEPLYTTISVPGIVAVPTFLTVTLVVASSILSIVIFFAAA